MKKLSSFVLAALLFVGTLLFITPNALAQTATNTVTIVSTVPKVAAGTTHGATDWQEFQNPGGDHGTFVDVDTSAAQFRKVPIYLVSLAGDVDHWAVTGSSSIYNVTPKGFRIYLRWDRGAFNQDLYAQGAKSKNWYINWIGIEPEDKVAIFKDANFTGPSYELSVGSYDINNLGIGNDQLSSLKVPVGLKVTLYADGGFQGKSKTFTSDSGWVGDDFNDITSSIKVERL